MLLYLKIMNQLIWEIRAGKYPVGSPLPCERSLAGRFAASQKSIHNAMRNLVRRGFVESRHGSGNYVLSCVPEPVEDRIAIIMNCSRHRNSDDFFAMETFMNQLDCVNTFARRHGIAVELLIYRADDPAAERAPDSCRAKHFLNLFFTAPPSLARSIRRGGGVILSTIHSFHEKDFLARYPEMPYVMCDYISGIIEAFAYYRANGYNSFAFFSQGEMGKANYGLYAAEAESQGMELRERHFNLSNAEESALYSGRRIRFFRQALKELPEGTVVFSDGLFHIAELFHALQEEHEEILLASGAFCITGEKNLHAFSGIPCRVGWIPACSGEIATLAAKLLTESLQEGKTIPMKTTVKAVFEPGTIS